MNRRIVCLFTAAVSMACLGGALAFDANVPSGGLPSAAIFSRQMLPERSDVVSWGTLAQVEPVKEGDRIVPRFAPAILALDRREARLQGFMIPLDMGDRQKRFLISAVPADCPFCLPAGPEALVEVRAKEPVRYTNDPIILTGTFAVLKSDPNGVFYRMTDATRIGTVTMLPPPAAARRGEAQD